MLKLFEGERYWRHYYIRISELVWFRNNHDGYKIEIYNKEFTLLDSVII
jgi:hypothetical protein